MKNIKNYNAEKYNEKGLFGKSEYKKIDDGVYEIKEGKGFKYVTSLSFVQEPNYGEGETSSNISQYPLEDILDKYYCYISDFYEDLNSKDSEECYLEFASNSKEDVINLREIIGRHVYNSEIIENNKKMVKLVIK
ncbi:MAG: hypothetical protein IKS48_08850 [Eubacterium sp.]|nr:hypothetical protein [Eubacterium sp.]